MNTGRFDGKTYSGKLDRARLSRQLDQVRALMLDSEWRTLAEIADVLGFPEASISARLRDLRKRRFGGYRVERHRRTGKGGTWEYAVSPTDLFSTPPVLCGDLCGDSHKPPQIHRARTGGATDSRLVIPPEKAARPAPKLAFAPLGHVNPVSTSRDNFGGGVGQEAGSLEMLEGRLLFPRPPPPVAALYPSSLARDGEQQSNRERQAAVTDLRYRNQLELFA